MNDLEILTGKKEGSLEIDFAKMSSSDRANDSKYEVAGRMYYEAHAFGLNLNSFTSQGFVDRIGYKKPILTSSTIDQVIGFAESSSAELLIGSVIFAVLSFYCISKLICRCLVCCQTKEKYD